MQPPFIEFKKITKIFGEKLILSNINLGIPFGEIYGIIGKSGSGKTTILNVLIGYLKPESGQVLFQSRDIDRDVESVRQQFGFAAQEGSFYRKLTVRENLKYFGILYNMDDKEIEAGIPSLLKLVDLGGTEDTLAIDLSSGMRKRLDIACAIIHNPKVLILDEPTEDLDPMLRKEIYNVLKRINDKLKVTIILTSHLLDEMEPLCSRIAIIDNKSILASGTVDELKDLYSKNHEIHLETVSGKYSGIINELKSKSAISSVKTSGHKVVIFTSKPEKTLKDVLGIIDKRGEKLMDVDVNRPSLNEVFESLTKKNVQANRDHKEKL